MGFINQVFLNIVAQVEEVEYTDLMSEFREHASKIKVDLIKRQSNDECEIEKYIKVRKRLSSSGNQHIFVVVDGKIESMKQSLWSLERKIKRRMKKGQKLVPQSVQCVDKLNTHGWWAAMEYDDNANRP